MRSFTKGLRNLRLTPGLDAQIVSLYHAGDKQKCLDHCLAWAKTTPDLTSASSKELLDIALRVAGAEHARLFADMSLPIVSSGVEFVDQAGGPTLCSTASDTG